MKVIIKFKKILQRFYVFGGTSTSQKCQVFLAPKNVSLEIQNFFHARNYTHSIPDSPV